MLVTLQMAEGNTIGRVISGKETITDCALAERVPLLPLAITD
jgi:hypothetical protein